MGIQWKLSVLMWQIRVRIISYDEVVIFLDMKKTVDCNIEIPNKWPIYHGITSFLFLV